MSADFDYYDLAHPDEGIGSGFRYKTVPPVTLKSIANNPEIRHGMPRDQIEAAIARHAAQEVLYDQPQLDKSRVRITGPFTVEAVPAPTVKSLDEIAAPPPLADASIARSGPTLRHSEWRDELLKRAFEVRAASTLTSLASSPWPAPVGYMLMLKQKGRNPNAWSSPLALSIAFWSNDKSNWLGKKHERSAQNRPFLYSLHSNSIPKRPKTSTP